MFSEYVIHTFLIKVFRKTKEYERTKVIMTVCKVFLEIVTLENKNTNTLLSIEVHDKNVLFVLIQKTHE